MSSVPEHWIPFIAVRANGSQRAAELQRASMPRVIKGDPVRPFANVKPRTSLLRPGLDTAYLSPFLVPEEEAPRSGARLLLKFRRARGADGRAHVWLGSRNWSDAEKARAAWPSMDWSTCRSQVRRTERRPVIIMGMFAL
jgi:hypothetical protein